MNIKQSRASNERSGIYENWKMNIRILSSKVINILPSPFRMKAEQFYLLHGVMYIYGL